MFSEIDSVTMAMVAVLVLLLAGMLLTMLVQKLSRFSRDLRYINMEIERSTGAEREYWQQEKRRLWLSWLPFYRR